MAGALVNSGCELVCKRQMAVSQVDMGFARAEPRARPAFLTAGDGEQP